MKPDKVQKLKKVAQLYFLENKTQLEIANILNVSRPLISRMLHEAKASGIVEIHIGDPKENDTLILHKLNNLYGVKDAIIVPDIGGSHVINQKIAENILLLLKQLGSFNVGLGWGHLIGELINYLEKKEINDLHIKEVFPLIGNGGFSIRNYDPNENVRIIAQHIKSTPYYLHLPAFSETMEEKEILCRTELYQKIHQKWTEMDTAIVDINNYPSTPDFASLARFGEELSKRKPQGQLLAYYFDASGEIIVSHTDYAIEIPIQTLKNAENVIGICASNVKADTLRSALKVGLFTHIIARKQLIDNILI